MDDKALPQGRNGPPPPPPPHQRLANGRFPKGVSGNPNGRPPKLARAPTLQQLVTDLMTVFEEPVTVPRGEKRVKVPRHLYAAEVMLKNAIVNNNGAAQWRALKVYRELTGINEALNKQDFEDLAKMEQLAKLTIKREGKLSKLSAGILNQFRKAAGGR